MNAFDTGTLPQASTGAAPGSNRRPLLIMAAVGMTLVGGVMAMLLMTGSSDDSKSTIPSAAPAVSTAAAASTQSAGPAPDLEPGPLTLTWKAHLTSSSGSAPAVGSQCLLTTIVRSRPSGPPTYDALTLQCQGQTLYDSSVPLNGASNSTFVFEEEPQAGAVGAFRYMLKAQDVGPRSGQRAQITVDTRNHELGSYRDAAPAFHLQASVDEFTAERRGRPLMATSVPPFGSLVSRSARVTTKSGAVPFGATSCELVISPGFTNKAYNCRVVLTCGGHVAYGEGTQGFDACTMSGGEPVTFADTHPTPTDGDPELTCDLGAGTCTLGDTSKSGATYTVSLALAAR